MVLHIDCVLYCLTLGTLETKGLSLDSRVMLRVRHWQTGSHLLPVVRRKRLPIGIWAFAQSTISRHGTWRYLSIPYSVSIYSKANTFLPFLPSSPHYLWILNFFMGSGMFGTSEPSMIIVITLSCVHIYHRGHWQCLWAGFWGPLSTLIFISEPSCLVTGDILASACAVPQSASLFKEPCMCGALV